MELVGQSVTHKAFGEGSVVRQDERHVFVEFADGSTRQFPYPGAFAQFLTLADGQLQAQVEKEIVPDGPFRLTAQQKVLHKIEAQAKQPTKQAAKQPAPRPDARDAKVRETSTKASSASTARKVMARTRAPRSEVRTSQIAVGTMSTRTAGKPAVLIAFQDSPATAQSGYLWAPLATADGGRIRSWDRLEELRPGDVILHCAAGSIVAVSRVMALWRKTSDLDGARRYGRPGLMGRWVDCSTVSLENPVWVGGYHDEIVGDEPTDPSDGGFAFELEPELASLFLGEAADANPTLARQAFVRRCLEG